MIRSQIFPALIFLLIFTVLTGFAYPLLVTGMAQLAFPSQANGSMIVHDGKILGSALIGQPFDSPAYFWGRLSATSTFPYNAATSGGSNQGQSSQALYDAMEARVQALRLADPENVQPIPVDLVTASASGLDPHISLEAAYYQAARVARERGLTEETVNQLILEYSEQPLFGFWGQSRVNVLKLNIALDDLTKAE